MNAPAEVVVEFFGVPRRRAGRAELRVPVGPARAALDEVARHCPRLADLVDADGRLSPHYLLSLDGQAFVTDLDVALQSGDHLLILSADAGG